MQKQRATVEFGGCHVIEPVGWVGLGLGWVGLVQSGPDEEPRFLQMYFPPVKFWFPKIRSQQETLK